MKDGKRKTLETADVQNMPTNTNHEFKLEEPVTMQDLHKSYKTLCSAVTRFERKARTPRSNWAVLTLCNRLVHKDALAVVMTYKNMLGRDQNLQPSQNIDDLYANIRELTKTLEKTCSSLFEELDKIESSEYYKYFHPDSDFLATRRVDDTSFPQNIHKDDSVGKCCIYLDLVSGRLGSEDIAEAIEILKERQEEFRESFMDFATLATFFSSITATTLPFSYANADTSGIWTFVNMCWFASLVLSVASAANSFLGAIVHQSPQYVGQSDESLAVQKWFRYFPSILLTFSGALFLIGVCGLTFAFSPSGSPSQSQGKAIQFVTTSLTSANLVALAIAFMMVYTPTGARVLKNIASSLKQLLGKLWHLIAQPKDSARQTSYQPLLGN